MNSDPSGQFFDTFLDIVSVITSFVDFITKPSLGTGATLAYDCFAAVAPGLPGSYIGKGASKISKTYKSVEKASTAKNIVKTVSSNKNYSVLYEASIGLGKSRSAHRASANKEFLKALQSDNQFKKSVDKLLGHDTAFHMQSGKRALKNPHSDWQWHHPADAEGRIQLIPKSQHQSPSLQNVLHPGPNGEGGFGLFK